MAIWLGKIVRAVLLFLGRGGTTLPGLMMSRIDPNVLRNLSNNLKHGSVVVTGTNGKTSTARIISAILDRHGYVVISNRSGSNLERGLVASYLEYVDWQGRANLDVAVLEVDEADLINILGKVGCRELVVTNFFRDQLDRYGELITLRDIVKRSVSDMLAGSRVVLNADDPLVNSLASAVPEGVEVVYFGMKIKGEQKLNFAVDVNKCVQCGGDLKYSQVYLSHLGDYLCVSCGFTRPQLDLSLVRMEPKGILGAELEVESKKWGRQQLQTILPGFYNVYNVLAAVMAVDYFEVEIDLIADILQQVKPAFGRFEKILIAKKELYLMLSKNPSGFNELLRTILVSENPISLIFILNDNYADGRDVSWIWDVDFEKLAGRIGWIGLAGIRAWDMMLRIKYANIDIRRAGVEPDYQKLVEGVIQSEGSEPIFVMATYTGMLEFRAELQKRGLVTGFWED